VQVIEPNQRTAIAERWHELLAVAQGPLDRRGS